MRNFRCTQLPYSALQTLTVCNLACEVHGFRKLDHLLERLSHEQLESQNRLEQQCNEAVAAAEARADQTRQEFLDERKKLESELKVATVPLF